MKRYRNKVRRAVGRAATLLVLAGGWCLVSSTLAQDFDFYAMDLIAQESYKKISMDFRDASLKDILKIFSEQSGLNFIASQSIQDRTVTLYLDAVPLNDALKKIMAANNLTYELDPGSNIFVVKETGRPDPELLTRVYSLRFARLKSSKLYQRIEEGPTAGITLSSLVAGGGQGRTGGGEDKDVGIEATVKNILTERGKVIADARTNSLIVTDVPAQFDVIEKVIRLLDTSVPQVMIEVEMLDVAKSTMDELGVDMTSSLLSLQGASRDTRFPNFFADSVPIHENGISSLDDGTAPAFKYGKLSAEVFTATLDFLRTDTQTKFLARPRILTLSNETAQIKIATNEAIGEQTQSVTEGNTSTMTSGAERTETGILMKVTPQVDVEGRCVTLFIEPSVIEAKDSQTFPGKYRDPEIRSTAAALMVEDGETIVVGGLIRTREEKTEKKWPILGDLPLIGMMFRHKDETHQERELLVFITPHIIDAKNVAALAQADRPFPQGASFVFREQVPAVSRKREVDSYLERWEN